MRTTFVGNYSGGVYRNFFTFDLTALPVASDVVSATFQLSRWFSGPNNEMVEVLEFFDVSDRCDDAEWRQRRSERRGVCRSGPWNQLRRIQRPAEREPGAMSSSSPSTPMRWQTSSPRLDGFFSIGGVLDSHERRRAICSRPAAVGYRATIVVVIPEPATGTMLHDAVVVDLRLGSASRANRLIHARGLQAKFAQASSEIAPESSSWESAA